MLQIKDLKASIGESEILRGLSLDVSAGEVHAIMGPNGSGKTTLGMAMIRLLEPNGGRVSFDGTRIDGLSRKELRPFRTRIQVVFQDPFSSLNPRMNILETVGEPLLVNGLASGRELEERVKEIVVRVGLRVEHLRRFPHSFSGGQRQRLAREPGCA